MKSNLYHLLAFRPATERWQLPPALEALAAALVHSGKLRINAEHMRNFVRIGSSQDDETFTARELTDPALAAATRARITRHVAPAEGAEGLKSLLARLMRDLKIARGVSPENEMKLARLLVQSAHPAVIQLLIASGTEMFVSYAHNVADLMRVHEWAGHGTASGLQATDETGARVYVSAGGDPFAEGAHKTYVSDGFPSVARLVVIAGQELGHFADLRRRAAGGGMVITGRHSVDPHHSQLRAAPQARDGRLVDMVKIEQLRELYGRMGLHSLLKMEKGVVFYHSRYRFTPPWVVYQLFRCVFWSIFALKCHLNGIYLSFRTYPYHRHGTALAMYLDDMAFNLAPDAEVYRNPDPLVEEAIAVIEAVARVPQQVNKWGHAAVRLGWPRLYDFYYGTIIPANQAALGTPPISTKISLLQHIMIIIHRLRPRRG